MWLKMLKLEDEASSIERAHRKAILEVRKQFTVENEEEATTPYSLAVMGLLKLSDPEMPISFDPKLVEDIVEARRLRRTSWSTQDAMEIAYWTEAAGISVCQLDLDDLLLLEDLHILTGSYILACGRDGCLRCHDMSVLPDAVPTTDSEDQRSQNCR